MNKIVDKSKIKPILRGVKIVTQQSNGLGNAFLEGLNQTKGDVIVLMDGDGSYRPNDLSKLLRNLDDEYKIAPGSKLIKGGQINDVLGRKIVL